MSCPLFKSCQSIGGCPHQDSSQCNLYRQISQEKHRLREPTEYQKWKKSLSVQVRESKTLWYWRKKKGENKNPKLCVCVQTGDVSSE